MWRLLLCVCLPAVAAQCYWNNRNSYSYFGSKTPYDVVRGDFRDIPPIKDCEIVSIWFMTRHGNRHPNVEDMISMKKAFAIKDEILKSYAKGRGDMCAQDIADLKKWEWDGTLESDPSILTPIGFDELVAYGKRFRQKFSYFLENLNQSLLRPTDEVRTRNSAEAFMKGLKDIGPNIFVDEPIPEDPVARAYRFCNRRTDEVINNTQTLNEVSRYQDTPEFKQLQANVKKRTGMDYELSPQIIMGIYDLCRFYRSYTVIKRDPWCALFNDKELKILEYVEDLQHYFTKGYGHPMNPVLGEAGLKDLYEKFSDAYSNGHKTFVGYLTHDTMLQMMFAAMGLYYDYPEISGLERISDRKWRTSFLTPFAANFVAVLHRCSEATTDTDGYKIQFFVNEKELHLCGKRLCDWNEFSDKFKQFSNSNIDFCDDPMILYYVSQSNRNA